MNYKILVVEDHNQIQELIVEFLSSQDYIVDTANDGVEGYEKFKAGEYDLVILDVMMPKMDGYEFTEILRRVQNELPILMVSAKQLPADRNKGFIVGTDDFMTKPFDEEELLLRVKALLRRAKIVNEHRIIIGEVILDYDSLTVKRKNTCQELPQKEFMLLYKLLSYPGKIFTRIQLMDEIWGVDSDTGWETVTVHVARLRKRFEDWPEFEIISVRGLGYKAVRNDES